jgi:predicted nucleic acid-binding protein
VTTRWLFDTSVYIAILRDATFARTFRPRYVRDIPFTHCSSVVIHELLAGTRTPRQRRQAALLYEPFERVGHIVTPSHLVWKEAAAVVATVFDKTPQWRSKIVHGLLNDILIALSGRAIGATVVTRNGEDFRLIQHYHPFCLEVI